MAESGDSFSAEINAALFRGEFITAVKLYREHTGCDLVTAREFCRALDQRLRAEMPEKFLAPQAPGSAVRTILLVGLNLLIILTAAVLFLFF